MLCATPYPAGIQLAMGLREPRVDFSNAVNLLLDCRLECHSETESTCLPKSMIRLCDPLQTLGVHELMSPVPYKKTEYRF